MTVPRDEFLSEEDLDLQNLTQEELIAYWNLWLLQAQATNELDAPFYEHGVFRRDPAVPLHAEAPRRMPDVDPDWRGFRVREYLARLPTDQDWARREADRFRDCSTDERFDALEDLLRLMQELLGSQEPIGDGSLPFWRHWSDSSLGRPR